MTPFPIPIRSLMPAPEDGVEFMPMPREMSTFEMPAVPEPGPGRDLAGAHDVLQVFLGHFRHWLDHGGEAPALDLAGLAAPALKVLNETLGEGEVAALVDAGHEVRVQETVFSGVWREQHFAADGALLHDYLLAAPIPPLLAALAQQSADARLRVLPLPAGAMNVPALVHELQEAMDRCTPASPPHIVNLTLLPLSSEDSAHLDALLAGGGVVILSRGFGNCRIASTAARHVWRVQYFNNMQTLILNTIEVVALPEVALAAPEDLAESHERLAELAQWMAESAASA
ncbi:Hydrogenase expression/formation protein HoxQ [Rubrivivax sp. A210]|uniref:hydrogenase expression/formation protein n=1 Tax=Rubrivivax sp. A210 TaxID=2772301 RepID=UPI0019194387|nr:hydrogenase expression/formation protein [Rubrivivax sp. A210]CAD5375021.1 Hydrogenase expression/formation protein HoxQ [Rubrivivax sp. A210]